MIAFEIFLNGERLCVAGIGDLGVLSAILTWTRVHREGKESEPPVEVLSLQVTGLDNADQYPCWLHRAMTRGDELRVKIVETSCVDQPVHEGRIERSAPDEEAKQYVRAMAAEWGWKIKE